MRRSGPAVLLLLLLAGCAGYAADYWKPKNSLIAAQLPRYGIAAEDSRCVGERLTKNLSVWQLRQLADIARRLVPSDGGALGPRDLAYVAGLVQDPKVGPEVAATLEACGAGRPDPVAAPVVAEGPPAPTTGLEPGATPPQALRWIDLGAAETGQRIAVDISTVVISAEKREGWFRLSNPGEAAPSADAYRLRVDCPGRTITPTAARKYAADGKVAQQEDYSAAWQAPLPIEAGTVMEIAWKRLCQ
ncbi:MAG TPA: hypothetical protein VFZ91_02935 [Allosphingosinicella sp.]